MNSLIPTLLTAIIIPLVVWWFRRRSQHLRLTIRRFKQIFKQHGFIVTQIPALLPEVLKLPLSAFESDRSIMKHLSPELLQWTADFFGVRREWLEGADDVIYGPDLYGYKNADGLFQDMEEMGLMNARTRMLIFTSDDLGDKSLAKLWIALEVPLNSSDPEDEHHKYIPLTDQWVWNHPPARDHLIYIASTFYERGGNSIPVYKVPSHVIYKMHRCEVIPNTQYIKRCSYFADGLD